VLDDCGVNVPVRGKDGQVLDALQEVARNAARSGIRGQEPVWVGCNRL
jgi:predicted RNA-binding protein Jag